MKAANHTPGHFCLDSGLICAANGRALLDADYVGGETEEEVAGNVALFVLAPQILAALRGMVENYIECYGDEGDDFPETVKAAIAVLAHADREL